MDKAIKGTQNSLGKLIIKPPLNEKLLSRPPFKFIHDIITSLKGQYGFAEGLYTPDELDSKNIDTKEKKIEFLQKIISLVDLVNGGKCSVKPTKIAAGLEPERTNEFFQSLAKAVSSQKFTPEMSARVLSGDTAQKPPPGEKKHPPPGAAGTSKGSPTRQQSTRLSPGKSPAAASSRDRQRDASPRAVASAEGKESGQAKSSSDAAGGTRKARSLAEGGKDLRGSRGGATAEQHKTRDRKRDKSRDEARDGSGRQRDERPSRGTAKEERSPARPRRSADGGSSEHPSHQSDVEDGAQQQQQQQQQPRPPPVVESEPPQQQQPEASEAPVDPSPTGRVPRPASAKGRRRVHDERGHPEPRLSSAARGRPPAPTTAAAGGNNPDEFIPPQVAAAAAHQPSERAQVETIQQAPDSDDDFVVEEAAPVNASFMESREADVDLEGQDHGGLVRKLIETKKELEGPQRQGRGPPVNEAARRRERDLVQREVAKLQAAIQQLTRSANPLGKIMDFLQEDLDSMQKELEQWQKENQRNTETLAQEKIATEKALEPLRFELDELSRQITSQTDRIGALKASLNKGDAKIGKMIDSVSR